MKKIYIILAMTICLVLIKTNLYAGPTNLLSYSANCFNGNLTVKINYSQDSFGELDPTLYQPREIEIWPRWSHGHITFVSAELGQASIAAEKVLTLPPSPYTRVAPVEEGGDGSLSETRAIIMNVNTNRIAPGEILIIHFTIQTTTTTTLQWNTYNGKSQIIPGGEYLVLETKQIPINPLMVKLASFNGNLKEHIVLEWRTESEINNAGFHIWRSLSDSIKYIKITNELIAAKGDSIKGASYYFNDYDIVEGKTYFYKLEDIDTKGNSIFHNFTDNSSSGIKTSVKGDMNGDGKIDLKDAILILQKTTKLK